MNHVQERSAPDDVVKTVFLDLSRWTTSPVWYCCSPSIHFPLKLTIAILQGEPWQQPPPRAVAAAPRRSATPIGSGASNGAGLLDLPPELLALIVAFLVQSAAEEPHDGRFHDAEPRQTLRNLCLVDKLLYERIRPFLLRRIVVHTMRQAFALEAALERIDPIGKAAIREIVFPLLKTTPCSPSRRGSPSISCIRAASLLKHVPDLRHLFCFDLRWEPKFEPDTTFDVFSSFQNLRKLSLYVGDGFRAPLVLETLLSKLGGCKSLTHLDLAATATASRDGYVECEELPPIESLTLIVSRPSKGSFDLRFWPHFVGRLSGTLRHLATNVGDYLAKLLPQAGHNLLSLTATPFTEDYEPGWWNVAAPNLRYLSLGWQGWIDARSHITTAKIFANIEVAVLGGYDEWRIKEEDQPMDALIRMTDLPLVRKIVATELKYDMAKTMEEEVRRLRPSIGFFSVPFGEVDMSLLAETGRIAYKYSPV